MGTFTTHQDQLIAKFIEFAQGESDIRAVAIVGSQGRSDHSADEWSDLDIIIYTTNPKHYSLQTTWLTNIGQVQVEAHYRTAANNPELLFLFEGGIAVDVVLMDCRSGKLGLSLLTFLRQLHFLPKKIVQQLQIGAQLYNRGTQVLIDKDGLIPFVFRSLGTPPTPRPPTPVEYQETISYFWCLTEKVARKIARGELYSAWLRSDYIHRVTVLPMIEWHAHIIHGWGYDTWYEGRFLEQWADHRILEQLAEASGGYGKGNTWQALFATMDLFRWLAIETGDRLQYTYPNQEDEYVTEIIRELSLPRKPIQDKETK